MRQRLGELPHVALLAGLIAVLVVFGALTTSGFASIGNFSVVQRLMAAFAIVAIGETVVVLGKGIDLSVGAVAVVVPALTMELQLRGMGGWAIVVVVALTVVFGVLNGFLVAFVELPALFSTLATGLFLLGAVNVAFLELNLYRLPVGSAIEVFGDRRTIGVPMSILWMLLVAAVVWLGLRFTSAGRLIRAMGDNFDAARQGGAPVRPIQVGSYVTSALLAALAGYVLLAREGTIATTGSMFTTLLFTALTVVIIGGVSLSGGRGGILGVLLGAQFVGIVTNLLTLNNLSPAWQDLIRGAVLMFAVTADAWLHPVDDETAKTDDL
jgi:ribose transport system permease protein